MSRAREDRRRRGMAQSVDVVVAGGVLLDVEVGLRDVRLWLVVVVVGDEVLDRVRGEELAELVAELRGERLVVGDHERGPLSFSISHAIVAVLPVPVAPSRVWKRFPASSEAAISAIAFGWSPVGVYAAVTRGRARAQAYPAVGNSPLIPSDTPAPTATAISAMPMRASRIAGAPPGEHTPRVMETSIGDRQQFGGSATEWADEAAHSAVLLSQTIRSARTHRGESISRAVEVLESRPSPTRHRPAEIGPAVTTQRPSGLNRASATEPKCPWRTCSKRPDRLSHSRAS